MAALLLLPFFIALCKAEGTLSTQLSLPVSLPSDTVWTAAGQTENNSLALIVEELLQITHLNASTTDQMAVISLAKQTFTCYDAIVGQSLFSLQLAFVDVEDHDDHDDHDKEHDDHADEDHAEEHDDHDDHDDDEHSKEELAGTVVQYLVDSMAIQDPGQKSVLQQAFVPSCFSKMLVSVAKTVIPLDCEKTSICTTAESTGPTTEESWGYAILSVVAVSLTSLAGLILASDYVRRYMDEMLAFSAGTLVGTSFFVLFPETDELLGFGIEVNVIVLCGIIAGMMLDLGSHSHHNKATIAPNKDDCTPAPNEDDCTPGDVEGGLISPTANPIKKADSRASLVWMSVVGDSLHNLVDGALIGATFLQSVESGLLVTLAICVHEIPQEVGDVAILLGAGYSLTKAIAVNVAIGFISLLGCIISLGVGSVFMEVTNYSAPFAGGLFLYLSLAGMIPAFFHSPKPWKLVLGFLCGLGLIALTLLAPHSHAGHGEGHDDHGH